MTMARPTREERLQKVHAEALDGFKRSQSTSRDERMQSLQDRRFVSIPGAMWEGALGEQFENRPKIEANFVMMALIRIYNEMRNNRISVTFVPKDGAQNDETAETCNGLFRADEKDSCAEEAYDNGFDESTAGGFGGWRLRACYEDEEDDEDERQRIRFEPIFDADSTLFFDVSAKRQDKSDAKSAWLLKPVERQSYIDEWNDDPATWPKEVSQAEFDWCTPDVVYIAEYYRVEETRETVRIFQTLTGEEERYTDADFEADEGLADELDALGTVEVRTKRVERKRVHKYLMSGGGILEDCGYIAGKHIPLIPVYGKRWFIDGVERFMGHVRLAKDAQRLFNMQVSQIAMTAAMAGDEKPIFLPEQMAGHQLMWANDNVENNPYLLVNPITGPDGQPMPSGPLGYTKPPQIAPAQAALLQITREAMAEILGNNQQAEKMVSNISGKAVELIQQRLDMQAFIYMSNLAKAMRRCGEVWLSMAKELYTEPGRKMKSIDAREQVGTVELMRPVMGKEGQEYEADLTKASFDVDVDVGPSFNSRRGATVAALTGMMQVTQDPQDMKVLSATAIMNMEGEGLSDIREYYRKQLVQIGAIPPNEEEQAAMAKAAENTPPDPQAAYLMAEAGKSQAQTEKAIADTELTRAKTAETLAGIDLDQQAAAISAAERIGQAIASRYAEPAPA